MAHVCSYRVFSGRRDDMRGHLCGKPAKNQRGFSWFCAIHTPEAIAQRSVDRDVKWEAEAKASRERSAAEREMRQRAAEWPQLKQRIAELEAQLTQQPAQDAPGE